MTDDVEIGIVSTATAMSDIPLDSDEASPPPPLPSLIKRRAPLNNVTHLVEIDIDNTVSSIDLATQIIRALTVEVDDAEDEDDDPGQAGGGGGSGSAPINFDLAQHGVILHSIELQFKEPPLVQTLTMRLHGVREQEIELRLSTPPPSPNVSPSPSSATLTNAAKQHREAYSQSLREGLVFPRLSFTIFSQGTADTRKVTRYGHLTPETIDNELLFLRTTTTTAAAAADGGSHVVITMADHEMVGVRPDSVIDTILKFNSAMFQSYTEEQEPTSGEIIKMVSYGDWRVLKQKILNQAYQTYAHVDMKNFKLEFLNGAVSDAELTIYLTIVTYLPPPPSAL